MATSANYNQDAPDEDATELLFPKEFDNAEALFISEVCLLLEHRSQQNEIAEDEQALTEVFHKTKEYCRRFGKFKNNDAICRIRGLLMQRKLHKFELVSLANLVPDSFEEAKALVPSLEGRFEDEELKVILDDLHTTISFQC